MAKTFYIADTHFFHKNIIKHGDRPFDVDDITKMNDYMIEKWNAVVAPEDTVIHIGDFAFGNKMIQQQMFLKLNGKKILVRGNHDGAKRWMLDVGFDEVVDYIHRDGLLIIHDPYHIREITERKGVYTLAERYEECEYLLHGHVHQKIVTHDFDKAINCCVEHHDYTPQTLEQLIQWTNK